MSGDELVIENAIESDEADEDVYMAEEHENNRSSNISSLREPSFYKEDLTQQIVQKGDVEGLTNDFGVQIQLDSRAPVKNLYS